MKAFVCVYRHSEPSPMEWDKTMAVAQSDPLLLQFLNGYRQSNSFFDWGDDPSFFAATHHMGAGSKASWGVCRRDVRSQLNPGDFVIWFCARSHAINHGVWDYHFIGCTTVEQKVDDRTQIWTSALYAPYRTFYNTLARPNGGTLVQHETFHDHHDDWQKRASAPYIIFSGDPSLSAVNLSTPPLVAKGCSGTVEEWTSLRSEKASSIEATIFTNLGISRRLRTTHPQRPHRHIALHNAPGISGPKSAELLSRLRTAVLALI